MEDQANAQRRMEDQANAQRRAYSNGRKPEDLDPRGPREEQR